MATGRARAVRGDEGIAWFPVVAVVLVLVLVLVPNPIKNIFFPKKSVRPPVTSTSGVVQPTAPSGGVSGPLGGSSASGGDAINTDAASCLFDSVERAPKVNGLVAYGAGASDPCTADITWDFCGARADHVVIPKAAAIQMWARDPGIDGFKFRWRLRNTSAGIAPDHNWSSEVGSGPVPAGRDGVKHWSAVAGRLDGVSGTLLALGEFEVELDLMYTKPGATDIRHTVRYQVTENGTCSIAPTG